jgi:hypothetical protein
MKPIYQAVIDDIDERIARLRVLREGLAAEAVAGMPGRVASATKGAWTKGRAKPGAGDDVIAAVVGEGADTMVKIIAASKVKDHVAKAAVRRLVEAGRIRKEGATVNLRYLPAKKK